MIISTVPWHTRSSLVSCNNLKRMISLSFCHLRVIVLSVLHCDDDFDLKFQLEKGAVKGNTCVMYTPLKALNTIHSLYSSLTLM